VGVIALPRRFPRCGDIKAILDHACDHHPNRLRKDHHSPPRRTEHPGEIRERQQRQGVGAPLYPIQRDHTVYEAAAEEFWGTPIHRGAITIVGSTMMFIGALPQFHRHSSHLGVCPILWELTTWCRFRRAEQPQNSRTLVSVLRVKLVIIFRTCQEIEKIRSIYATSRSDINRRALQDNPPSDHRRDWPQLKLDISTC
jgi:hypothetical protein